jgi:hypothetical protein
MNSWLLVARCVWEHHSTTAAQTVGLWLSKSTAQKSNPLLLHVQKSLLILLHCKFDGEGHGVICIITRI